MTSVADFIKLSKIDTHNHLDIGMRYSSYVPWAGFYIPDFPVTQCMSEDDLFSLIAPYTHARTRTEKDVFNLFNLSLTEAVADGITVVEGIIDIGMAQHCNGIEGFANIISKTIEKFKDRLVLHPILGVDSSDMANTPAKLMLQLLRTGLFAGIDLYGKDITAHPESHKELFKLADNFGLKKEIHGEYCSTPEMLLNMIKILMPDEVQQGICAAKSKETMKYIADNKIKMNICPQLCVQTGALKKYGTCPIRKFADSNIRVSLCTDSLLLFNKSLSEQCSALCNDNLFTKEEMIELLESAKN